MTQEGHVDVGHGGFVRSAMASGRCFAFSSAVVIGLVIGCSAGGGGAKNGGAGGSGSGTGAGPGATGTGGDIGITTAGTQSSGSGLDGGTPECDDAGNCTCIDIASLGRPAHYGAGMDDTDAFQTWLNTKSSANLDLYTT